MRKILCLLGCLLLLLSNSWAQSQTVSGKITDESGSPVGFATISEKGKTSNSAQADINGNFTIRISEEAKVLVISAVGYATLEVAISGQSSLNISLKQSTSDLEEVVVLGYETRSKKDIAGATAQVKGKDIANMPVASFTKAMQGRMAGVQVISSNGIPGGNMSVRIRGVGSINAGIGPLYIIDGVQVASGDQTGLFPSSSALNALNPEDIESIDVIKDPAAASIFGAQAANGVVIVTTKRGKAGQSRVTFNTYVGKSNIINKIDVLTAPEVAQLGYEAYVNRYGANASQTLNYLNAIGGDPKTLQSVDWQDLVFRDGSIQDYSLSASGGSDKTKYFMSASYNGVEGHVIASSFQRGSLRINLDHKINNKLTVSNSLALSTFSQYGNPSGGAFANPYRSGHLIWPSNQPYDSAGNLELDRTKFFGSYNHNVLAVAEYSKWFANTKKLIGNVALNYQFTPAISFRTTFNADYSYVDETRFYDPRTPDGASVDGRVNKNSNQFLTWQTNQVLTFAKKFNQHDVSALAGFEYKYTKQQGYSAAGTGIPIYLLNTLSATAVPLSPGEGFTDSRLASVFAKVNYIYDNRYILNLTLRRDGSSRFGSGNQFGYFPGISFAWKATNESFLKDFGQRNDLKLRLSYGVTGNDRIDDYGARTLLGLSGDYLGLPGVAPSILGNDELTWEENHSVNAGVDFSFLNNRIFGSVDYFVSNRKELLLDAPLPITSGWSSILRNVGVLRNKGIEIELGGTILQARDFSWMMSLNYTKIDNEVTQLLEGQSQIGTGTVVGRPLNSIFTYKYAGVNPADGRPMYYDTLGNITYVPVARDRYYLPGTSNPDFYGGITSNLQYKGFELKILFQFSGGNYVYFADGPFLQRAGSTVDRNQARSQLRRWQKPGDITDVPRPYYGGTQPGASSNYLLSDRFFEKGDYARLKEVTLSYNLPASVNSKLKLVQTRIYVSAVNMYTWTNYSGFDPELLGDDFGVYPQGKQLTAGLQLTF